MEIPNLKTRKEIIKERIGSGEPLIEVIMSGMFGDIKNLPEYNDADEIYRKASEDIRRMDFGDIGEYIDSMSQLVDYWKELAEHYLSYIDTEIYILDDNGYLEEIEVKEGGNQSK